jgi:heavy metal efflux system protein
MATSLVALLVTGAFFCVSSSVNYLASFGVSLLAVHITLERVNRLRACGDMPADAAVEASNLRHRPIMTSVLVAICEFLSAVMRLHRQRLRQVSRTGGIL